MPRELTSWSPESALGAAVAALAVPGPLVSLGLIAVFNHPGFAGLNYLYDRTIAVAVMAQSVRAFPFALFLAWYALRTVPMVAHRSRAFGRGRAGHADVACAPSAAIGDRNRRCGRRGPFAERAFIDVAGHPTGDRTLIGSFVWSFTLQRRRSGGSNHLNAVFSACNGGLADICDIETRVSITEAWRLRV